ncbi:MAG: hypothetical protein IJW33_01695 [Lentisphaeria bacterium]|nr:hypothetical protein [Lentisphaeria bacterium]
MAWQCILGIVIMVVSFIGVLITAKMRMEPMAILCAIVMLVGLGLYGWYYFNPPPNLDYQVYGKAVAAKMGATVKAAGVSKAVWVTGDASSEYAKSCYDAFKTAFGGDAESLSVMEGDMGMMELNPAKLRELLKGRSADEAVVLDVSMMMDPSKIEFIKGSYKGAKIFLTNNANMMGVSAKVLEKALNKGSIVAMVTGLDNIDAEFTPDEDDLEEAFSKRYVIVTKDNFAEHKAKFGMM